MTKARKIDLLYRKAKGQGFDVTPDEKRELMKYKVMWEKETFVQHELISVHMLQQLIMETGHLSMIGV